MLFTLYVTIYDECILEVMLPSQLKEPTVVLKNSVGNVIVIIIIILVNH